MRTARSRTIWHWKRKWLRRWPVYVIMLLFCITGVALVFLVMNDLGATKVAAWISAAIR